MIMDVVLPTINLNPNVRRSKMAKPTAKQKLNTVTKIFNDLDKLRDFCRTYGYRYNESDLYSNKSYVWRQYTKFTSGKEFKDQWGLYLAI